MQIVLASNNRGKLTELQTMLSPLGVQLLRQGDLGVGEAPEPHCTFVENALAKRVGLRLSLRGYAGHSVI